MLTLKWRSFEARRLGWYRAVDGMTKQLFAKERGLVVEAVRKGDDPSSIILGGRKNWQILYNKVYTGVAADFAPATINTLKTASPRILKAGVDAWLGIVLDYLKHNSGVKIRGIEGTTLNLVREAMAAGVEAGEGADQIAKRVGAAYDLFTPYRSERITRTEVVGASNLGSRAGALSTGLDLDHSWLTTRDGRERADHAAMDGQRVPIKQPFTFPNGTRAYFPGDNSLGATPDEIIQCRCVAQYHVNN